MLINATNILPAFLTKLLCLALIFACGDSALTSQNRRFIMPVIRQPTAQ
jgi:hypothetical protein